MLNRWENWALIICGVVAFVLQVLFSGASEESRASLAAVVCFIVWAARSESYVVGLFANCLLSLAILGKFRRCVGPEFQNWPVVVFLLALAISVWSREGLPRQRPATAVAVAAFTLYLYPINDYVLSERILPYELGAVALVLSGIGVHLIQIPSSRRLAQIVWLVAEPFVLIGGLWACAFSAVSLGPSDWLINHLLPNIVAPVVLASCVACLRQEISPSKNK